MAKKKSTGPSRKQLGSIELDEFVDLIAANHDSIPKLPWLQWIFAGTRNGDIGFAQVSGDEDAQQKLVSVLEEIIDHGAVFDLADDGDLGGEHALAQLIDFDELEVADRNALLARAIAAGADPTARLTYPVANEDRVVPTRSALDAAITSEHPEFLATIEPHVSDEAWPDAYLYAALAATDLERFAGWLAKAGDLDRESMRLGRGEAPSALIHVLARPDVQPAFLEHAIAKVDLGMLTSEAMNVSVPTQFGAVPYVRVPAGSTALDLVEATLRLAKRAETANARKPFAQFRADETARIIEYGERKVRALEAAAAPRSKRPTKLDLPAPLLDVATQLTRLATKLGVATEPLHDAMSSVDPEGLGPWSFLQRVVPQFEADLLPSSLASAELHELLGIFSTPRWYKEFSKSKLPKTPKVELAVAFHEGKDGKLLAVKMKSGTEIWHWNPSSEAITPRAKSVAEYLANAIDRAEIT